MLSRKATSKKTEKNWFHFSNALSHALAADYIALRILYFLEPLTTAIPTLSKALDVAEKSLKLFVIVSRRSTNALSSARSDFGHNIEKVRAEAARLDSVFDDARIKAFTRDLNDKSGKLYQLVRYGSEGSTEGFSADLNEIMPAVDRLFFQSVMKLDANDRKLLFFGSPMKHVLLGSQLDQTQNRDLVLAALRHRNAEIHEFEAACHEMESEHAALQNELWLAPHPPGQE